MTRRAALFAGSAPSLAACPRSDLPEIALIGRSNVGKSSLINMLTRVKDLAKVSAVPGKTRLINFFTIEGNWSLVDLPGYGFTKGGKGETDVFSTMVADYLLKRKNLILTTILIDSRLEPQPIDLGFVQWVVNNERPFALVFTKTDKLSKKATHANVEEFLAEVDSITKGKRPPFFLTSSLSGDGRREVLDFFKRAISGEVTV